MNRPCLIVLLCLGLVTASVAPAGAQATAEAVAPAELAEKGAAFLAKSQSDDGSFSPHAGPGVTAIVAASLLANGHKIDDPVVAKALKYVEKHIHPDGGIYAEGSTHRNYETCIAMMAFGEANADKRYDDVLKKAEAYIKKAQWDVEEGHDKESDYYGGAGYGGSSRPDLSNTAFLIDALRGMGEGPEDPAIQAALVFVSRCQNLKTDANDTKFASLVDDGGFYYTIAKGGSSPAGQDADGGLRSYGSMTYAGLKSMIYAGVGKDDPRVKAAVEWLNKHYTLDENPGMGDAGLYYYLHTAAKALKALGDDKLTDAQGVAHDWRADLAEALAKRQQPDGSWKNSNERWLESDPNLVTAYALLALSYAK